MTFERAGDDFRRLVANDLPRLLQSMVAEELPSALQDLSRRSFGIAKPRLPGPTGNRGYHGWEYRSNRCGFARSRTNRGSLQLPAASNEDRLKDHQRHHDWLRSRNGLATKGSRKKLSCRSSLFCNDANRTSLACRVLVAVVQRDDSGKRTRSVHVVRLNAKDDKRAITTVHR